MMEEDKVVWVVDVEEEEFWVMDDGRREELNRWARKSRLPHANKELGEGGVAEWMCQAVPWPTGCPSRQGNCREGLGKRLIDVGQTGRSGTASLGLYQPRRVPSCHSRS